MHTVQPNEEWRALIERFWDGNTSLEEEERLRQFCASGELPQEFEGIAAYFQSLEPASQLGNEFDDGIMDQIPTGKVVSFQRFRPYFAAATVAGLLFAGWYAFSDTTLPSTAENEYSQEEIQQAWNETRAAFKKVGKELNKAQEHAAVIDKFNDAQMTITGK